nr:VCBS repeat-containing protein [Mucilaginibacter gotjawali]
MLRINSISVKTPKRYYSIALAFVCFINCGAAAQQPLFKLLSPKETNIKFSNDIDETESLNVLSYEYFYNGGGVAVGDINDDGLQDLMFTGNMGSNKLYLNLGHMKFKDITKEACPELEGRSGGWKTGVTMADVNGDGLLDIYICYSGKVDEATRRNQLFINLGSDKNGVPHFKEEAKAYGLDDPGYGTQAVFLILMATAILTCSCWTTTSKRLITWSLPGIKARLTSLQAINFSGMITAILPTYQKQPVLFKIRSLLALALLLPILIMTDGLTFM